MEQLCTRGMYDEEEDDREYLEDDRKCKEDDKTVREDDIDEEDDLWVSQLYTDVDYSLLDTPTNLSSKRVVTNHGGWSGRATPVECQLSKEEIIVDSLLGTTERCMDPTRLIYISHDGPVGTDREVTQAGGEERIIPGDGHVDNTSSIGGVHQDEVRPPWLSGDNTIVTSMLVPTKRLVEPSMDNAGNLPGKHSLLSLIDFDDAETPDGSKKDDQEADIQVLHQQPPPLGRG